MSEAATCPICLEDVGEADGHTLDGCNHRFHAGCLIPWLRGGNLTCPSCRTDLRQVSVDFRMQLTLRERSKYVRSKARSASAPPELKRMVEQLRKSEVKQKEATREYREYKRLHSDILKKHNRLRNNQYSTRRQVSQRKRLLGLFEAPGMQLPALVVTHYG